MNQQQARQVRQQKRTNPLKFALQLGFFAGLIWGGLHWLSYLFQFTIVVPGFLVEPFYKHEYLTTIKGQAAGLVFFIFFSIAAAILYTLFMRKIPGPWAGMLYGLAWWFLLFVAIGPWIGLMPPVRQTTWNTIWTEACTMLLWGLFIGYTVATEFNDERLREPDDAKSQKQGSNQGGDQGPTTGSNDKSGGGHGSNSEGKQPEPVM
ncbi:YqhR family membrane protein [Paenibacillus sp. MER TA 81-3]|uniref:YqhR family membrane protein n=1 Tax=Paenibacillus sp. MER TA 81-3 TaxID=2939573 RepID=UPI00203FADF9|nr:YqhR family membrane protein [Paenibacillus sp. MER TA 81-3]MCM3340243.1 YqhR family membrane protein [Paenibacillus sp. MER TA 81-3]